MNSSVEGRGRIFCVSFKTQQNVIIVRCEINIRLIGIPCVNHRIHNAVAFGICCVDPRRHCTVAAWKFGSTTAISILLGEVV